MDSIPDFLRKYGGCWIKRNINGQVFFLNTQTQSRGCVYLESDSTGGFDVQYGKKFLDEYSLDFPEIGFFQYKKWALLLLKGYARQYQRGLSPTISHIVNPMTYFSNVIKAPGSPKLREDVAVAIWNRPNYRLSLDRARSTLLEEKLNSIAVSKVFSVSLSHFHSGFILWNLMSPVAILEEKDKVLTMIDKVFHQEVRDYLARTEQLTSWKIR